MVGFEEYVSIRRSIPNHNSHGTTPKNEVFKRKISGGIHQEGKRDEEPTSRYSGEIGRQINDSIVVEWFVQKLR
jgi:hypothetical protein